MRQKANDLEEKTRKKINVDGFKGLKAHTQRTITAAVKSNGCVCVCCLKLKKLGVCTFTRILALLNWLSSLASLLGRLGRAQF